MVFCRESGSFDGVEKLSIKRRSGARFVSVMATI